MRYTLKILIALPLLLVSLFSLSQQSASAASINDFVTYSYLANNGSTLLPGLLHVPPGYATNPNTPRPLILFLHGAGESGTDNRRQINGNIDNLLATVKTRDAFLYAPQTNAGWGNQTLLSYAMSMIDRAIADRSVDPNRIYVTGLSMGGGGTWNFLHQFRDRVAAAVPICAVFPNASFDPANVVGEAIWAFHGRSDTVVPVEVTREMVNSIASEAGVPLPEYPPKSMTFFPNTRFDFPPLDLHYTDMRGDHGIWGFVYNRGTNGAMYDWLFAHGVVPEPTGLMLAFVALGSSLAGRRHRTA